MAARNRATAFADVASVCPSETDPAPPAVDLVLADFLSLRLFVGFGLLGSAGFMLGGVRGLRSWRSW